MIDACSNADWTGWVFTIKSCMECGLRVTLSGMAEVASNPSGVEKGFGDGAAELVFRSGKDCSPGDIERVGDGEMVVESANWGL